MRTLRWRRREANLAGLHCIDLAVHAFDDGNGYTNASKVGSGRALVAEYNADRARSTSAVIARFLSRVVTPRWIEPLSGAMLRPKYGGAEYEPR